MATSDLVLGAIVVLFLGIAITFFTRHKPKTFEPDKVFKEAEPSGGQTILPADSESDPLAEADFHIAYGLYDEAIDILRSAIQRDPTQDEPKLKLFEVLFVSGDAKGFAEAGKNHRDSLRDSPKWSGVKIMAEQICPNDPTFL